MRHEKIDYAELPCGDFAAMKQFFGAVFGWTFTDYGDDYCAFDGAGGLGRRLLFLARQNFGGGKRRGADCFLQRRFGGDNGKDRKKRRRDCQAGVFFPRRPPLSFRRPPRQRIRRLDQKLTAPFAKTLHCESGESQRHSASNCFSDSKFNSIGLPPALGSDSASAASASTSASTTPSPLNFSGTASNFRNSITRA